MSHRKREYNPVNGKFEDWIMTEDQEDKEPQGSPTTKGVADVPFASNDDEDRRLRLECLRVAAQVAKIGLSHDVFATAERYYAFVTNQPVQDPNQGLDFLQRLDGLVLEFLREEKSDPAKIVHELGQYLEGLTERYPKGESEPDESLIPDEVFDIPPIAQHRNINA